MEWASDWTFFRCGKMWMRPAYVVVQGSDPIMFSLVLTDSMGPRIPSYFFGLVGKFRWEPGSLGRRQFGLQFSVQDARWQWTRLASPWTDLTRWSSWNELALNVLEDKPVLYRNNIRAPKRKRVLGLCEMFGDSNICHLSCFVRFNDCLQQLDTDKQLACFKVGLSEQHIPTVWGLISYVWLFESNFIIVHAAKMSILDVFCSILMNCCCSSVSPHFLVTRTRFVKLQTSFSPDHWSFGISISMIFQLSCGWYISQCGYGVIPYLMVI